MNTATDLKQQVYQVIEQLPPVQLLEVLRFSEGLLHSNIPIRVDNAMLTPAELLMRKEHPWLWYADILKDTTDWEEFSAAIAEVRRELNQVEIYDSLPA